MDPLLHHYILPHFGHSSSQSHYHSSGEPSVCRLNIHSYNPTGLGVHYLITKIFATAIVMVWNFVTRKIFLDAGDAPQGQKA